MDNIFPTRIIQNLTNYREAEVVNKISIIDDFSPITFKYRNHARME
jgi:hypothetical protein